MTDVANLQWAPGPPAVNYDPIKSVEWALGSVQEVPGNVRKPYPWEPAAPADPKQALPIFGAKQADNSPLDFGPYKGEEATLSTLSWPGQRPAPSANIVVTLFVNDMNGNKMLLVEGDDDADTRFGNAIVNPSNPDTKMNTVQDVSHGTTVPGSTHYSKPLQVAPSSLEADRVLRKPPPKRCPQSPADLELYVGVVKMDDGQLEFNRSLNSGAKPHWKVLYLSDFMIADGTVLRAEYTLSSAEFKMKDPDRDMNQLGALPDLDTACLRVRDTVFDPDFYVSTTEQVPRMLMDFLFPPKGDEDGPFVGRLQPIPDTAAKTATRRVQYRTDYVQYKTEYVGAAPVARPLQTQQIQQYVEQRPAIAISSLSPRKYVETRSSISGDATIQGASLISTRTPGANLISSRGREIQSTLV